VWTVECLVDLSYFIFSIIKLHRMHELRTIAVDDPEVCLSVCHAASLCKRGSTDRGPALGTQGTLY